MMYRDGVRGVFSSKSIPLKIPKRPLQYYGGLIYSLMNRNWTHLPYLCALIGNERLKESHLFNHLSNDDIQIINDALRIVKQKIESCEQEANLRGRVKDSHSFVGLLSELFWCNRLAQLGYSFELESKTGGVDFRLVMDQLTVCTEVKTIQELTESRELRVLSSDLKRTISKQIRDCSGIFFIRVQIGRNFSRNTIKPLAAIIRRSLLEMSLFQKKDTFNYPEDACGSHNNQAKVTISRDIGKKTDIWIIQSAKLSNAGKLLKGALDTARKQSGRNDVNVVFVDKTFRSDLEDEDIQDVLYGKLVHDVSFSEESGEPESIIPFRWNDGFYDESSRISAVVVYQRKRWGMSDIQDSAIYTHPESCKLTDTEMEALQRLSGC